MYQGYGESQEISLFFYDFFLPHARLNADKAHFALAFACCDLEHTERDRGERAGSPHAGCILKDFGAGVVFLFHSYSIAQDCEKARIFFAIVKLFLLTTTPPFLKKNQTSV